MEIQKTISEKIYEILIKWPLFVLVAVIPVLFLPWTGNVLDLNKQLILVVLASVSLFAWLIKSLVYGNARISVNPFLAFVSLFAVVYLVSGFFSAYRYGSLWGIKDSISRASFTVFYLAIFYFLVTSELRREEVIKMLRFFAISSVVALLFGVLQLAGRFIFRFPFSQAADFNTIGSVNSLGIFAAVLFPLALSLVYSAKRVLKWLLIALIILVVAILAMVNFKLAWMLAAIGAAMIIILVMQKRDLIGGNRLIMPMFFLAVSLVLVFFNFRIPSLSSRSMEVYLNQKTGLDITSNVLKEKPIFGSGPATFSYDFAKYKSADFNKTLFWNARFENSSSKATNTLAETGALGGIAFLLLLGCFLFYGLLFSLGIRKQPGEENKTLKMIELGVFVSFALVVISYFFYGSNLALDFYFFLVLAAMSVFFYPEKRDIALKTSSISTLLLTFVLMVIFIANLGVIISGIQRYTAEVYHFTALSQQAKGNTDAALADAERAVSINQASDVLLRDLAQIYIIKLNKEVQRKDISVDQLKQNVQKLMQLASTAAQKAATINPSDSANWSVKGYIYQSMIPLYIGFDEESIKAFDEAIKLEPTNPYYPTQQGIALLTSASQLKEDQKADKEEKLSDAEAKFNAAIELKADYALAMYQLSVVYQAQGKTNEAIAQLQKAEIAVPNDAGLPFQLGLIYYGNNNYNNAKDEFEKAVGINGQYSNALYFLGLTYDKLGNRAEAVKMIEKVSSLNPDNEDVRKILENLKAGRGALEGLNPNESAATPISQNPAEIKPDSTKK